MAIAITSIPVLSSIVAFDFEKKINENNEKKGSIDFSKELSIALQILEKAKIK